jgi:predicted nucleic acid-binding protein
MEKEIVSNASSIIFIGKIQIFSLVKNLFTKILLPEDIIKEIFQEEKPENPYIRKEIGKLLRIEKVKEIKDFPIDKGERASISLCIEKKIFIFLSDDKKARRYARSLGLNTMGVLGIILENLKQKRINKPEAKKLIKRLIEKGYYMGPGLYDKIQEIIDIG